MKPLICSKHIDAPSEVVFEIGTDVDRWAEVIDGIKSVEKLTDGPFGVGTRFKETRVMFGKEATEEMTVVAVEPGRSYTTTAESCGNIYNTQMRFVPDAGGTRMEMEMSWESTGFFARLMGAVMGPLMAGSMKKMIDADLEDVKRAAEGAVAAA